ncbi:MAG: signal peptidase I [Candidatus Eremiobacteraeota bacterium]|nr:signal peptidase I [Candidatus Eremiobacteraeota bacterium]
MRLRAAANLGWQIVVLVVIALGILALRPGQVSGYSMEPRIAPDEYVLINALAYRLGAPRRGDIIAFRHERSAPEVYLKRVIGVPGDRLWIDRGVVRVNGAVISEPYVRYHDARSAAPIVVPPLNYYVLGDNRPNSDDSRAWGFVPAQELIGRAFFAVWPPPRIGPLQ